MVKGGLERLKSSSSYNNISVPVVKNPENNG